MKEDSNVSLTNEEVLTHTASLWKYNPVPHAPEPFDEYRTKNISFDGGEIFGASVRGKKHKHEGTNGDDYFEFDVLSDWVLICVSDGAGSKKLSRIGAKASCEAAISFLKKELLPLSEREGFVSNLSLDFCEELFSNACQTLTDTVQRAVIYSYEAVCAEYEKRKDDTLYANMFPNGMDLKDFSATFLCAVAIPVMVDGEKQHLIVSCQVGDGILASFDVSNECEDVLRLLGEADSGEFSGETEFLVSKSIINQEMLMNRTKVGRRKISHFMIMSDGVADDYYPNNTQLIRLFIDLRLNGVLYSKNDNLSLDAFESLPILKNVPAPIGYAWVNDPSVIIKLHYTDKILDATSLGLFELFKSKDLIDFSALAVVLEADNAEEKLKIWLDNYVFRGSFDDRTLVILKLD